MKRRKYLAVVSILSMLILALVAVIPASADRPVHEKYTWDTVDVLGADDEENMCGVELTVHSMGKLEYFVWFNRNGEPQGDVYHPQAKITYILNNHEVTFQVSQNLRYTWLSSGETSYQNLVQMSGATAIATIPGHGVVYGTLGRQVVLETCHLEGTEWVCVEEVYHEPGMVFNDPETVCNYLINGE